MVPVIGLLPEPELNILSERGTFILELRLISASDKLNLLIKTEQR